MAAGGPWSVKGIDPKARETAREAARREGKTLGEWLNAIILEGDDEPGASDAPRRPERFSTDGPPEPDFGAFADELDEDDSLNQKLRALAKRIESAEHRSTLAITGMDQSILGLISRLDKAEDNYDDAAHRADDATGELREAHQSLAQRLKTLEEDDRPAESVKAVQGLEDAVATVAGHVHQRDKKAGQRFGEVEDRLEALAGKLEKSGEELAKRIDATSDHAAMQARRETESLRQAFETHRDASESTLEELKSSVDRINERLGKAERLTDNAVRALEASFANLDDRLRGAETSIKENSETGVGDRLEKRFTDLSGDLRSMIEASRADMANQLEKAASAPRLQRLEQSLSQSEQRHSDTLAKIGEQISLLGQTVEKRMDSAERRMRDEANQERGLETRLREVETNSTNAIRRIGDEVAQISERLSERLEASEARNAESISALGDRLERLREEEDETGGGTLEDRLRDSEKRTQQMIREAMAGVGAKLDAVRDESEDALSPVQSALADLARRLDSIEGTERDTFTEDYGSAKPRRADEAAEAAAMPRAEDALAEEDEEDAFFVDEPAAPAAEEKEARPNPFASLAPETDSESVYAETDRAEDEETLDFDSDFDPEDDLLFVDEPAQADAAAKKPDQPEKESVKAPPRPAPLGATADPGFLSAARNAMRQSESGNARDRGSPILGRREEPSKGRTARVILMGAGALATLTLIGAAAMLFLTGNEQDGGARVADPLTGPTVGDVLNGESDDAAPDSAQTAANDGVPASMDELSSLLEEPADAPADAAADTETASAEDTPDVPAQADAGPQPADPEPAPETQTAEAEARPAEAGGEDPVGAAISALPASDQFQLGMAELQNGEQDAGVRLVRAAADSGYAPAQYRLGKLFETGLGVPQDPLRARQWTERAANNGNRKAMHNLGVMYAEGRGASQDMNAAAQWFERAALLGAPDSQFNLAVLYEQGRGRPRSLPDAYAWYTIAAQSGDEEAGSRAARIAGELPEEAAAEARQMTQSFEPRPLDVAANSAAEDGAAALTGPAAVARAQTILAELGYDIGQADGNSGPQTQAAIILYQRENGLAQTGEVSPRLLERLEVSRRR
ncbi:peptidoglycan-binding protein [Euryhalocaulis caribicus]|uniref:peptidoglycan-binding protein n=1 Tax=Euryhalocaulis caribicus TaxID=1161401 RepID=UPI0003A35A88|nr:peptidoglycan-binding protein [Euryhalocaulis caribicus]